MVGLDPVLIVNIEGLDPVEVDITGFIVSPELSGQQQKSELS